MKRNDEHTVIFIISLMIAAGIASYRGLAFDLFTIIGIFPILCNTFGIFDFILVPKPPANK